MTAAPRPDKPAAVPILRHLLRRHGVLAALLVLATLVVRMVVPAGYMISGGGGGWSVTLCSGVMPAMGDMPGMAAHAGHHAPHGEPDPDRAEMPCAFAGLATLLLGGAADPLLLPAAIAFAMALATIAAARPLPRLRAHLRPPLRGPPAAA